MTPHEETERLPQTSLRPNTMAGRKLKCIFFELLSMPIWPLILLAQPSKASAISAEGIRQAKEVHNPAAAPSNPDSAAAGKPL